MTIRHIIKLPHGYTNCHGHAEYRREPYAVSDVRNDLNYLKKAGLVVSVDLDNEHSRSKKMWFIQK